MDPIFQPAETPLPAKSENKRKEEQSGTAEEAPCSSGRERLKGHRVEVAGRVWIPDIWAQEDFLKDWADCAAFDASLVNSRIVMARDSLMKEGRRPNSAPLRIHNGF